MKRLFLLFILLSAIQVSAQELSIKSFVQKSNDLSASTNPRHDNNDTPCALVKVQLASPGAKFEGNVVGKVKYEKSEYWVYMAKGSKKVKIMSDDYLPLEVNFADYGIKLLESKVTYELRISIPEVGSQTPNVTSQYLVFKVSPADAVVKVNETIWPNNNGVARMLVPFGEYTYLIQSKNYHSASGKISVDDPANKKEVEISLKPNFGWIEVKGSGELLGASVYIDNNYIGKVPVKSEALKSGQYEVLIAKELYNSYSAIITVSDNQTSTVTPSLVANFSNITLKVDDDAEIWVNDEKKGIGNWTGNLESGNYKVECKKTNHQTSTKFLEITNQMKGKTINLDAPKPICGSLNVETNPDYAELYIDGKKMGETPLQINSILIGQHTLRIEKVGCATISKTITIEENKTITLEEKLDTGRNITIKTDRESDNVYVDNNIIGNTPCTTSVSFGSHTIKVVRGNTKKEKSVNITPNDDNQEIFFEFGRLIHITTDQVGDVIYIDSKKVGTSPLDIDLDYGSHIIHATRGKKYADKGIYVEKTGGYTTSHLVLHGEPAQSFVSNGVNFVTLNFAYGTCGPSFGFAAGSVKKTGWYVSAMSNFNFAALNSALIADSEGCVDGNYPDYNGQSATTRISIVGGFMFKIGGPIYGRIGAGFGNSVLAQGTFSGDWVKQSADSSTGADITAGIQLNLKGFTFSLDAVSTNFNTFEAKFGIGACWKKK